MNIFKKTLSPPRNDVRGKLRRGFILILVLFFTSCCASAAEEQSITYKNQRGSVLTLIWHADTKETGTL